jgi:hypothetical protein
VKAGGDAQSPHTPTLHQQARIAFPRLAQSEHDAGDPPRAASSSTTGLRVRLRITPPHIADDELRDPAAFIGSDRLSCAYMAATDDATRRKLIARARYERHRWTRALPLLPQQRTRVDEWWRKDGRPGDAPPTTHRAPGRPRTNRTAQVAELRARVEQAAGVPWDGLTVERRRGLVVRLAAKSETSAAAALLGVTRRTITRMRSKEAG